MIGAPCPVGEDEQLIQRVTAGDERALGELYRRHGPVVLGLARRVTGSMAIAEEVAQEVFVHLWSCSDRYDAQRGSVRTWLTVLAHRRAVDRVRSEARRSAREGRVFVLDVRDEPGTELGVERGDMAARVRAGVDLLPADQREALHLAYFSGLTYRQVADRLGIPEGTAKSRLRLALAKLSAWAESEGLAAWI